MAGTYPWPDALDGVIAAPDHHFVIFENDEVMTDTRERPDDWELPEVLWSESTPLHKLWNPSDVDLVVVGVEIKG